MDEKAILLVEDNRDDEQLILMALKQSNVRNAVEVARDGQEALDVLFGAGGKPGAKPLRLPVVVLLDLHLPKLDGLEVLERIRGDESTKLLPVVILTSSKEENDRIASYRLGANSFVCKPVVFGEFTDAVKALGLYWVLINTPARD
jgi:two-component system response regulator